MFSSHSNKERHKREHCHKYQQLGNRKQEAQEVRHCCPMTDCQDTFVKSVHVKRHLASSHGVSNPLQWMEEQGADVRAVMAGIVDLDKEEEKVPPLKIKL